MQDAGAIRIELDLADGLICAATIRSTRPFGLRRLFEGRAPHEAPTLARRLFTLCSRAQGAAASAAIAAALGEDARVKDDIGVLAERAYESLRACLLSWPGAAAYLRKAAPPLRQAAAAAEALAQGDEPRAALGRLNAAAEALGVGADAEPPPDSAFAVILRQCAGEHGLARASLDGLSALDDAAVAAALEADPARFAAAPQLDGRQPETGAYVRAFAEAPAEADPLTARALARRIDIRRALSEIDDRLAGAGGATSIASGRTASGAGYGAVECARGRLYHLARLNEAGQIGLYALVAPTEWNFHPSGPLATQLIGARVGRAESARALAAKLACLIDPCVAFEIAVKDYTDA